MTLKPTSMVSALEGEQGASREAALKAAHNFGLSEDDPLWVVVRAIREGDHALVDSVARFEQALRETAEKLRESDERMAMTRIGYESLDATLRSGLEDLRSIVDERWDRCEEAIDMARKLQRWLLGLLIGSIALWALASPAPVDRHDNVPTAEEAAKRNE